MVRCDGSQARPDAMSAATFHLGAETVRGSGTFAVRWGQRSRARMLARFLRLPREGPAVPVRVEIERMGDQEVWRRWFAGRPYITRQTRRGPIRIERIGPLVGPLLSYAGYVTEEG